MKLVKTWLSDNGIKFVEKHSRLYVDMPSNKHTLLVYKFKSGNYMTILMFNVVSYEKEDIQAFDNKNADVLNQAKYVNGYMTIFHYANVARFIMFSKDGSLLERNANKKDSFYNVCKGYDLSDYMPCSCIDMVAFSDRINYLYEILK